MAQEEEKQDYIELGPQRGHTRIHVSRTRMIINNFLGGLAWGFGTVLGATVVAAIVIFILSKLNTIPIIGKFISNILEQIQQSQTIQ